MHFKEISYCWHHTTYDMMCMSSLEIQSILKAPLGFVGSFIGTINIYSLSVRLACDSLRYQAQSRLGLVLLSLFKSLAQRTRIKIIISTNQILSLEANGSVITG